MTLEILFKNGIFFSLFLSMLSFWGKSFSTTTAYEIGSQTLSSLEESKNTNRGFGQFEKVVQFLDSSSENFFLFSFFFISAELLFRWVNSGHPPLSNLYESLLFFIWGLSAFFLFWSFGMSMETNVPEKMNLLSQEFSTSSMKGEQTEKLQRNQKLPDIEENRSHMSASPALSSTDNKVTSLNSESSSIPLIQKMEFRLQYFVGGLLSSAALFIETFADWRLPSEMKDIKPLIPALQSNWLLMHVSIMILSYSALLIGCLLAISYIAFMGALKSTEKSETLANPTRKGKFQYESTSQRVVFLNELDSLSFRILAFGFPLLTLGILSGAVWANEAWGSYWSWDPKETWAFITWLIFAFYLHTRLQYGWEGKKSAYVATFGFFILWICYLGVNLLGKGLHSYGWLS